MSEQSEHAAADVLEQTALRLQRKSEDAQRHWASMKPGRLCSFMKGRCYAFAEASTMLYDARNTMSAEHTAAAVVFGEPIDRADCNTAALDAIADADGERERATGERRMAEDERRFGR